MEYIVSDTIGPLSIVGVKDIIPVRESYKSIFSKHFLNKESKLIVLDDMLSKIFTFNRANIECLPIYNLTNALTQIFLNNQKVKNISPKFIAFQNIGLMYPSVVTSKKMGINLVIDPKIASEVLNPNIGYRYRIIEKEDEHNYKIQLTHKTSRIFNNGEMKWSYLPDSEVEYITDLEI